MLERPDEGREPGATFALGDIGWIDFETHGREPISCGTDRYSRHARAILIAWAIGGGPVSCVAAADYDMPLAWLDLPQEFRDFYWRVTRGEAVFCAHKASFDRAIWNHSTIGFPALEPEMIIDSRVQAVASGLPGTLEAAARFTGTPIQKDKAGKELIKLFTLSSSTATPQSHPAEWAAFCSYARDDIGAMRGLFQRTRQLPIAEWREYWAAERINDRGVGIDLDLAAAAAKMAAADQKRAAQELVQLTGGGVSSVNQVARMIQWLTGILPADGRDMLVKRYEEVDPETKEVTKAGKDTLARDRVIRLLAYLGSMEPLPAPLQKAQRLLQIRLYGGSKTPAKFSRMLQQHVDGVIRGQYSFNGASQTGRFSATGVQVHNLMRDAFAHEIDAIDALVGGASPDDFAALGDDTPISRKLSLLIRPTLVAGKGRAFVWGDWSNIEARLVPWLSLDREAEERLGIFRDVDAGVEKYDIYTRTTAALANVELSAVTPATRQQGKVVELACGFGGGTNALLSMAASYGIHLEENIAKAFVERWRGENQWAVRFWGKHDRDRSFGLWGALNTALEQPGQFFQAGRVGYIFLRNYLGGSLFCRLPSGRYLTYRKIRWELVDEKDDDDNVIGTRRELMFSRDMGRIKLWPGLACENVVQATAADILRGTLATLDGVLPVRLHTHDEVLTEVPEAAAARAAHDLGEIMEQGFTWSTGLPIAAETVVGRWYSKQKGSLGL